MTNLGIMDDKNISILKNTFNFNEKDFIRLGRKIERYRCLEICAKHASVEGIAQKIADEIERGES